LTSKGIPAEAVPGGKGQFDVIRDGSTVFSKQETGRFPEHDEVRDALLGQ
jgi:hypothetical protein